MFKKNWNNFSVLTVMTDYSIFKTGTDLETTFFAFFPALSGIVLPIAVVANFVLEFAAGKESVKVLQRDFGDVMQRL